MYFLSICILLFLATGCQSPVYEHTILSIEEFVIDSQQITQNKMFGYDYQEPKIYFLNQQPEEETIKNNDELFITLYCPQRPDRMDAFETIQKRINFRVCDGKICLPYLFPIEVEGLTLDETCQKIQNAYCEQVPETRVFVNFKKWQAGQVQIIGGRKTMVPISKRTRLSQVWAKAQPFPHTNLFKSYVMRRGKQLPVDLHKLILEGDESQNIVMQGGDQIFIANIKDASIMVTGEVGYPIVIPVPYGSIPLREALALAGGIPFTGNKNCIHVIRGGLPRPKIYLLIWNKILQFPNQSLMLKSGDVIVVSEKPITQWNHFISQLQPNTTCLQTASNIYKKIY